MSATLYQKHKILVIQKIQVEITHPPDGKGNRVQWGPMLAGMWPLGGNMCHLSTGSLVTSVSRIDKIHFGYQQWATSTHKTYPDSLMELNQEEETDLNQRIIQVNANQMHYPRWDTMRAQDRESQIHQASHGGSALWASGVGIHVGLPLSTHSCRTILSKGGGPKPFFLDRKVQVIN